MDNYNEKNLEALKKHKREPIGKNGKVYIMVNKRSAPCKVTITKQSRKICAEALLK